MQNSKYLEPNLGYLNLYDPKSFCDYSYPIKMDNISGTVIQ